MTFEKLVKKHMGVRKFDKLPQEQKKDIREISSYQSKTKAVYSNGSLKAYEALGIL